MDKLISQKLTTHFNEINKLHIRDLFESEKNRFQKYSVNWHNWLFDYSKQLVDETTLKLFSELWQVAQVEAMRAKMLNGELINDTEKRAVLHFALRKTAGEVNCDGENILPKIHKVLAKIEKIVNDVQSGKWLGATGKKITHIVNIGIGGSDLGPRMAAMALSAYRQKDIRVDFVANLDSADLALILENSNPENTLFIIASKTFTTQETMQNAFSARSWLVDKLGENAVSKHFVAVSTNLSEVAKFGINPENAFEFWDWVGGRFSLWSAIGLPLAFAIGYKNFRELLAGGEAMDEHFFSAPPLQNLPALMAFLEIWNVNFRGIATHAVLPYSQSLSLFPRFLQQLEMESNGKSVDRDGRFVEYKTAPITWGEPGTNGQHAFYQLIHQGTQNIACDFMVCKKPDYNFNGHHSKLLANCFAQAEALLRGKTREEAKLELEKFSDSDKQKLIPNKAFAGNQPSTMIVLPELNPFNLGALISLYEHKVFVCGVIWNINSFDQWGVELGKVLANKLLPMIEGKTPVNNLDSSTAGLINFIQK